MVEINNQRKAFLDIPGVVGELITDVRKPEIMVMTSLWAESYFCYSDHPRKLVTLNPKLKSTGAGPRYACSRWWDAYRKRLAWRLLSGIRTLWHCSRLRSVALYPMIDRGDIRQAIDRYAAISGRLHCRALVMVSSSIRLTAWLQKFKEAGENGQKVMYEQSHRDYLRFWLPSSSACHGLLIITVITPLPTKQHDKNAETEAGERGNYWHAKCVSVMFTALGKIHDRCWC